MPTYCPPATSLRSDESGESPSSRWGRRGETWGSWVAPCQWSPPVAASGEGLAAFKPELNPKDALHCGASARKAFLEFARDSLVFGGSVEHRKKASGCNLFNH